MTILEALWAETSSSPASSLRAIQGQSEIRSRALFSADLRRTGSMWSGMSHPGPSTAKSVAASARSGSGSWGSPPPGAARSRARRRSMDALTLGGLHIRSPAPARTASRSRANRAGTSVVDSALRACLSRTSSATRMSAVPGIGQSRSRQTRFAKPDRSAVSPCLTTPTVFPSGRVMAASRGAARYQRNRTGNATSETAEATL